MDFIELVVNIMELIGTIAFASSGAVIGIKKEMDIFGVVNLGVITATGGGLIRDIVIGVIPPTIFNNSFNIILSIIVSNLIFIVFYFKKRCTKKMNFRIYEKIMVISDAVGLGIFTVLGIRTTIDLANCQNKFLLAFGGVTTAVGGGVIRDILSNETPLIFMKHIYACSSIIGSCSYVFLWYYMQNDILSIIISVVSVIIIRIVSVYYDWNLPQI